MIPHSRYCIRFCLQYLLSILVVATGLLPSFAQETAYPLAMQGVRYEESPGVYHYVAVCGEGPMGAVISPDPNSAAATKMVPALCWQVRMMPMQMHLAIGKQQSSSLIAATLVVTASIARFVPSDIKDAALLKELNSAQVVFKHDPGRPYAFIATPDTASHDVAYAFAFVGVCKTCQPGSTAPPPSHGKQAQLDAEYQEVGTSLRNFDSVYQRINEISKRLRFGISPLEQPDLTDVPEAMGLYAALNQKLLTICPDTARACIESYQHYESCHAGSQEAKCESKPTCSASCTMTTDQLLSTGADSCLANDLDYAVLYPDWSKVVASKKAEQARLRAEHSIVEIHIGAAQSLPATDPLGKPLGPPCNVESLYAMAFMPSALPAGAVGMSSMATASGSGTGTPTLSPLELQARRVKGDEPAYTAVAKAARIEGTVVLRVVINKAGTLDEVQVLSGPPLLQQSALATVKTWQYQPYLLNGQPARVISTVNLVYQLGGPGRPGTPTVTTPPVSTPPPAN